MALHVRIVTHDEGEQLIADLPDWPYPLPQVGHALFHPPFGDESPSAVAQIAGHVKSITWRMYDRPTEPYNPGSGFVMTAHPYVEIVI